MSYLGNSPGVSSQRVVTTFTATDGQTNFVPQSGYTLGYLDVYRNGIRLVNGVDYTAANGTDVTLTDPAGAALNDVIETVSFTPRGLSDGYTKTEADARYEPIDTAYTKAEADAKYLLNTTDSFSGNLSFGDNSKAIFGAGGDLEIYHSGSASYINDLGQGDLYITGAQVVIADASGSKYFEAKNNDQAVIYANGAQKLATTSAGIDVTGTITADNNITINRTTEGALATFGMGTGGLNINYGPTSLDGSNLSATRTIDFIGSNAGNATELGGIRWLNTDSDNSNTQYEAAAITSHNGGSSDDGDLRFITSSNGVNAIRMYVGVEGNVGIGTASPSSLLHVQKTIAETTQGIVADFDSGNGGVGSGPIVRLSNNYVAANVTMNNTASGDSALTFETMASSALSEGMRLDSDGNLLVGKTIANNTTVGHNLWFNGQAAHAVDSANVGFFDRKTSDGSIIEFRKDGGNVGTIGVKNSRIYIGVGDTAIRFEENEDNFHPWNPATNDLRPDAIDIGRDATRFKNLYLSGVAYVGDWTITESGGSLYFATGGVNKMKLDASGNLQVVGNVESNATIS